MATRYGIDNVLFAALGSLDSVSRRKTGEVLSSRVTVRGLELVFLLKWLWGETELQRGLLTVVDPFRTIGIRIPKFEQESCCICYVATPR